MLIYVFIVGKIERFVLVNPDGDGSTGSGPGLAKPRRA
ncbi:hypothetical protein SAMN05216548_102201 [Faunimonas pinastri]|uniref:Uncharacterized protein n=1 Tax=Faunimonas pinastri TaxID=1855383 RepID=A0A1H9CN71_9HYPH|nr:hypothetical protein SAMN05216548_102201 [Faunimonas pinastri]